MLLILLPFPRLLLLIMPLSIRWNFTCASKTPENRNFQIDNFRYQFNFTEVLTRWCAGSYIASLTWK